MIAIAVPNTDSVQARAFGDRWLHLDIPRHLVHLSTATLCRGLVEEGFRVERISSVRGGQIVIGWVAGLVGALPGGLDLYQARSQARARRMAPMSRLRRAASIVAGVVMLPLAVACSAYEVARRRAGTVYVEARLA